MGGFERLTVASMKEAGYRIRWKDKALTSGQMGVTMKVIGSIMKCMARESIAGPTGALMMVNGRIIRSMVMESSLSRMVPNMMESLRMT